MNPAAVLSVLVQARGIEETNRRLRDIDKTSQRTAASTDKLEKKFSNLDNTVGDFNRSMTAAGNVVRLVKFPAMIAGAGMAAQALGSLAAAGVAAGAALAPLAGASAGVAGGYLAMGQAAGVARLALSGLEDAISGDKDALKKLTPTQREFVKQIQASAGEARGLRSVAQRGLLPGLTDALKSINPLFDRLRPIVGGTATVMGLLARQAGALVGSDGVLDKISRIGKTNIAVIRNVGTGALALGNALITVLDAARPLTKWFSDLAMKTGLLVNGQVSLAAKSGALVGFLEQTRVVMSRIGRIAADVAVGLFNIAKAGKPLGDELLVKVVRLAEAFKDWTQSASGQNQVAAYFKNARGPILEIAGLLGDVGGAILRLSRPSAGTTGLVAMFRPLVPLLEDVVKSTTSAFGPVLINALANVLRVAAALAGTSGPLTLLVRAIGAVAGAFATLLNTVPGMKVAVVSILGIVSVTKVLTAVFGPLIAVVKSLQVALIGQAAAASTAGIANLRMRASLVATAVAMYAQAAATKIASAAQWLWNAAMTANPIGLVIVGLAALGAAVVLAYKKSETFRDVVNATWNAIRDTTMAVLNWLVPAVRTAWGAVSAVVGIAVRVVKGYVAAYAAAAKAIVGAIIDAFGFLKGLPAKVAGFLAETTRKIHDWEVNFANAALGVGKSIGKGIVDGLGDLGHLVLTKVKDALDFVTDHLPGVGAAVAVGKAVGSLVGDGAGRAAAAMGASTPSGTFGGSLMGARPSMAPFAAAAARFGLGVSSGKRPGAITSSGNVSYHSTGEAIDVAGAPAGMMGFFRQMKSKYGGRLAELIYGPGQIGVKNGQPYNFGSALNAQHMDHVHVAFDTGVPGVGDGIGRAHGAMARISGTGDGLGFDQVARIAENAGLPGVTFAQLAQGESTLNPNAVGNDPGGTHGYGLWQITSGYHDDLIAKYGGAGRKGAGIFLPSNNAKAAKDIWDKQGKSAWYGTSFVKGWNLHFKGSSSKSGSSKSAAPKAADMSAAINAPKTTIYDPGVSDPFSVSPTVAAQAFTNARKSGILSDRPLKGGGPTKGLTQGQQDARTAASLAASVFNSPFAAELKQLGAAGALAALTPDNADNIAVAQRVQDIRGGELDLAKQSGDPERIQEAAENFKNAMDALVSMKADQSQQTAALVDALKGVQDALKEQTDFAKGVESTSNYQLTKTLADLVSGHIVGRGVAGRAFTPGSGVSYAY